MKKPGTIVSAERRKAMVPAAVTRALDSFKAGVDAYDVAALDGLRGKAHVPADATAPTQLSEAIDHLACLNMDWSWFESTLVRWGQSEMPCRCGAHFVTAFLIRQRWSLIVLGRRTLQTSELLPIRTLTMEKLARLLPHLDEGDDTTRVPPPGDPRGGGGTAGPAELAIPLWWVRRGN